MDSPTGSGDQYRKITMREEMHDSRATAAAGTRHADKAVRVGGTDARLREPADRGRLWRGVEPPRPRAAGPHALHARGAGERAPTACVAPAPVRRSRPRPDPRGHPGNPGAGLALRRVLGSRGDARAGGG